LNEPSGCCTTMTSTAPARCGVMAFTELNSALPPYTTPLCTEPAYYMHTHDLRLDAYSPLGRSLPCLLCLPCLHGRRCQDADMHQSRPRAHGYGLLVRLPNKSLLRAVAAGTSRGRVYVLAARGTRRRWLVAAHGRLRWRSMFYNDHACTALHVYLHERPCAVALDG
jgi:hypothetical protein